MLIVDGVYVTGHVRWYVCSLWWEGNLDRTVGRG